MIPWDKVRERIHSLGERREDDLSEPMAADVVKDAMVCAAALEGIGVPPPHYAWHCGGRFTFGWHQNGYRIEFRSDGTCHASEEEPFP